MVEKILFSEFKKLPLEQRAQIMVRNHFWGDDKRGEVKIIMDKREGLIIDSEPFIEAWSYAESEKYVECVGGTPKSGPAYKITSEGLKFMDKAL
jgi:hypothetical protein